jgi:glycosyltransferase involved in cell wall biosynthesis
VDPVGVWSAAEGGGRRRPTVFTQAWRDVVAGATSADLPAFTFQHPCNQRLAGFAPLMSHWTWQDAGRHNKLALRSAQAGDSQPSRSRNERPIMTRPTNTVPDLVVVSHLRWPWVWQRPQHLVSRLADARAQAGARTFFVEEPEPSDVCSPQLVVEEAGPVVRIVLQVPENPDGDYLGFADPGGADYPALLAAALSELGARPRPDAWLYTPMALPFLAALDPGLVIYDVMDDLASFEKAPAGLRERQLELLAVADVVFTGGRSLHRSTTALRAADVHMFASGVETEHYARAKEARNGKGSQKVAGYIGVIDERLDLALISALAEELDDWTIRMVGPVAKIEEEDLPRAANIEYPGMVKYENLPDEMARFDVALMPFALNEATAKISPTKTLEYFAAGLPVVSTRIADVLADCGDTVHFADDAAEFAEACRRVLTLPGTDDSPQIQAMLRRREWDFIAESMNGLVESTRGRSRSGRSGWRQSLGNGSAPGSTGMLADLAEAHRLSVRAATEGVQDPSLGSRRLGGDAVPAVAEAAVVSATPYLRAPLLTRMSAATRLHPQSVGSDGQPALCPTCLVPVPCPTAQALQS